MTQAATTARERPAVSAEMLASMGAGHVAYVRQFQSEDFKALFPDAPDMAPGQKLWALVSADGTPMVLADTPQAVMAKAMEQNLVTVSVH